jgi:heme exporter protein A
MEWSVENLACKRGQTLVLEGVGFTVAAGEALILRGPNGSGKTTLLRCIAGLTPPVAGTINAPDDAIAYASHADGLKAQLTVTENLAFWADVFRGGAVDPAIAAFDLDGLRDRPAGALSAGQKRRLSLARLLVTGRPVWILDEPTVSLDAANVARFAAAVRTHLAGGGSALIATHIDLGLEGARTFDIGPFAATGTPLAGAAHDPFAEALE